jgi:alpha-1,2-mannosyltransferase
VPAADIEPMIGSIRSGRETRLANLARFAGGGALFVGAAALTAVLLWHTARGHGQTQLIDLKIFRRAGHDVLSGVSPYPVATVDAMRGQPVFVYPAPAAVLFTALAVPPFALISALWLAAMACAMLLALRLAGVTDARVAAVWFLAPAMAQTFVIGSFAPLLALCAALVWRYRDRAAVAAPALALAICLKLLLLPLVVWLAVTGRHRAAVACSAITAAACLIGWAIVGPDTALQYPQLLSSLSTIEQSIGFSTTALAMTIGLSPTLGQVAAAACAAALCALGWRQARCGDERAAFCLCLVAGLVLSPIVWMHYLAIVAVAFALYRPRLSALWLLPLAFWPVPNMLPRGNLAWLLLWHAMLAAALWPALRAQAPPVRLVALRRSRRPISRAA